MRSHLTLLFFLFAIGLCIPAQAQAELPVKSVPVPNADEERAAMRTAIQEGLSIVQKAARNYPTHRDCFSCHHQTLPMLAMDVAGSRGFAIAPDLMQEQADFTWQTFDKKRDTVANGRGIGGASMTVAYGLWALHVAKWQPDDTTSAMVEYLLKKQDDDGSWHRSTHRPPLEQSNVTCTILSVYYMEKFATAEQKQRVEAAKQRAREWIRNVEPATHEDRVSLLGALALLKAPAEEFQAVRDEIVAAQREDGGWGQTGDMESDAYATGLALFTLHRTRTPRTDPNFQRGVDFLLRTQCDDGSWFVESRSKPIQEMFDNGDPHGEDQFISISGTAYATAALALALPESREDASAYLLRDTDSEARTASALQQPD